MPFGIPLGRLCMRIQPPSLPPVDACLCSICSLAAKGEYEQKADGLCILRRKYTGIAMLVSPIVASHSHSTHWPVSLWRGNKFNLLAVTNYAVIVYCGVARALAFRADDVLAHDVVFLYL